MYNKPGQLLITWQELHGALAQGLAVKSPASGFIQPLQYHTDPLYRANVLPQTLCMKLQHDTLVAPFAGFYDSCLQNGRRLSFRHKTGLTLQLDLPQNKEPGRGWAIKPLVFSQKQVKATQPILRLDPKLLQDTEGYLIVLTILPHPAISAVFSTERFVEAGLDNLFTIQLKNKQL